MAATEEDLVQRTLEGDQRAFEEIVRRYQGLVLNIVYHYLGRNNVAEDMAQEVFVKLYTTLSRFDRKRSLKAWIGRITANQCIDELRRTRRQRVQLFSDFDERQAAGELLAQVRSEEPLTVDQAEKAERLLQYALARLSASERMAFVLHEMEGLPYSELAATMGTTELAARIRVSRSRKKLRKKLEELLDEA
jgi:RNA polymerase sigma-70 factor, ECF subfamily